LKQKPVLPKRRSTSLRGYSRIRSNLACPSVAPPVGATKTVRARSRSRTTFVHPQFHCSDPSSDVYVQGRVALTIASEIFEQLFIFCRIDICSTALVPIRHVDAFSVTRHCHQQGDCRVFFLADASTSFLSGEFVKKFMVHIVPT
jgi:hypothetical protein